MVYSDISTFIAVRMLDLKEQPEGGSEPVVEQPAEADDEMTLLKLIRYRRDLNRMRFKLLWMMNLEKLTNIPSSQSNNRILR